LEHYSGKGILSQNRRSFGMSGRYLLDTNAIIHLLQDARTNIEEFEEAEWLGISVLSKIELLCFPNLSDHDRQVFHTFEQRVAVVDIENVNHSLLERAIEFRIKYKLKLPDALIAASAVENAAVFVTNDKHLLGLSFLESRPLG
jgi:predicted nucleic acid-binding protein